MKVTTKSPLTSLTPNAQARWKWMAGSTAAAAAATSASMAGTVQITINEQLNSNGTGSLSADLTKDGTPDLLGFVAQTGNFTNPISIGLSRYYNVAGAYTGSNRIAFANYSVVEHTPGTVKSNTFFYAYAAGNSNKGATPTQSAVGLFPVNFTDARINGGAATNGFLDVSATSASPTNNFVQFLRVVFDDANTAAPGGVSAGGTDPEFADNTALKSKLTRKIKKLKKKLKKTTSLTAKAKLKKKIKKLQKKLKAL